MTATREHAQSPAGNGGDAELAMKARWLFPLIAVVLVAAAYARAPGLGFVYDDDIIVKGNPYITSASHIPSYFTEHIWSNLMLARKNYYRPVFLLWLLGNFEEFGTDSLGWHVTSLLLHLGSSILLYFLALRFTRSRFAALSACLIFGLHPVQVENVVWVSASTELLGSFLALGSVLCYLRSLEETARRMLWLLGAVILYALAVFAKETAIIVPAIIFLHEWLGRPASAEAVQPPERTRGAAVLAALRESLPFGLVAAGYLAARIAVLGGMGNAVVQMTKQVWFETIPSILQIYLLHLVWPARLSAFYDYPYIVEFSVRHVVMPAALIAGTVILLLIAIRQKPEAQLAAVWMALPILPVLDIPIFPRGEFLHDRYLYHPLIGLSLLIGLGVAALERRWPKREARWTIYGVCGAVALVLGIATFHQTGFWADNFALYSRGVDVAPRSAFANNNLGSVLMNNGQWGAAMEHYQKAIEYAPNFYLAYYDMGMGYYQAGRFSEAEGSFQRAVQIMPEDPDSHLFLGMVYYRTNRRPQAINLVRQAIALKPDRAGYHFALAVMLKDSGDLAGARAEFEAELKRDPNHQPTLAQLRLLDQAGSATPATATKK
jgi:Tfp pilus assembly protein PilF